jgi:Flp pilus assembly protein TadD
MSNDWSRKFFPWLIVGAGLLAYYNSFTGAFIFDDADSITTNPTIRHLWPPGPLLSPPKESTVQNRPVANLTLAINYALGGTNVIGYHALNLAIHVLAGLALFGIVRRTLRLPSMKDRWADAANGLALAVALIWTVHPLQTEAVTYVVQRTESLMGLLYLLTLYAVIRGAESAHARWWFVAAVVCCALGMGAKEVMATAPLMVLLYDRTFLAGSFREALRRRWSLYAGLAATWALLAVMVWVSPSKFHQKYSTDTTWWMYVRSQPAFISHYLRLSFWPAPLVVDYGTAFVSDIDEIVLSSAFIGLLVAGTVLALRNKSPLGFLGAWFFVILAPSSSVFPLVNQTVAEKRMYLPLAAVITLVVFAAFMIGQRLSGKKRALGWGLVAAVALALTLVTIRRNFDYRSEFGIWQDVINKRPDNARAHYNIGMLLLQAGKIQEAIGQYEQAVRIKPDYTDAHNNLGSALLERGRVPEAMAHWQRVLQIEPDSAPAHNNMGVALERMSKLPEAIQHFKQALRVQPDWAEAHNNLAIALAQMGNTKEAMPHWEEALRLKPEFAEAHNNLGLALLRVGRTEDAIAQFEMALRLKPDLAEAHKSLGDALMDAGRTQEAVKHLERAQQLKRN